MSITEQQLRQHLHTAAVIEGVDATQAIAAGRRHLRGRRRRGALVAVVPAALIVVAVGFALSSHDDGHGGYELVGSGLTLAAGSFGPVQVSDNRVDLGDGLQAWREDKVLSVGYPDGSHAFLNRTDRTVQGRHIGYDAVRLDPEKPADKSTAVVGLVNGEPSHVEVTFAGVSRMATIACFTQAPGWCSYAAVVPVTSKDFMATATVRIW